jgi:hypothetical protein
MDWGKWSCGLFGNTNVSQNMCDIQHDKNL